MKKFKIWGALLIIGCIFLLPNKAFAEADFSKLLTNGKLVINSVKPTNDEMAYTVIYEYMMMDKFPNYYINWEKPCNKDYSKCTIYYNENGMQGKDNPNQEIEISWKYDKDVKTVVDTLVSRLDKKDTFNLNEIEFINYLVNLSDDSSMINYSSELKKAIDYKNFSIDVRLGDDSTFYTERGGNAVFSYNGTIYYVKDMTVAQAKHIIYVDDNTTNVLSAIKEKLVKAFGEDFNVVEKGSVADYLESEKQGFINRYNPNSPEGSQYSSALDYASKMMDLNYYNEDAYYHFVTDTKVYEKYYSLTINNEEVNFLVIKDSSKANSDVNLITSDVESNVTISSTSKTIPLDTLINVAKLTSGTEYNKIVKTLNITNLEMFDLKLFSKSTGNYITKLSNGTFEVKIPIKEEFKGKNLVVYYINENNKIEEYEVTIKNNYAVFNTNHFSIYSLAEKNTNNINEEENPKTSDNVLLYVVTGIASLIGLGIVGIYTHKKIN